jgi:hypothetical protein
VPATAVKAPASLTPTRDLTRAIRDNPQRVVATASASGIPEVALTAYQRAATIIDAADTTCHMPWQLVAAIGRVESDHGRVDGNALTSKGIAEPGIFGPVLDGRHGTTLIRDTDAGQYDGNTTYDRAVGPMQFIPSTWAIVGVDADNDGQRNPQDIYDAALASAVYLCSGPDDLSTVAGQRSAVFRYNHSQSYVALVLAIEQAYRHGEFSAVPNGTTTTGFVLGTPPLPGALRHQGGHRIHAGGRHHGRHTVTPSGQPTAGPTTAPTSAPTGGASNLPTPAPTKAPTKKPSLPLPSVTLPSVSVPTSAPTLLTTAQAILQCLAQGLVQGTPAFQQCVADLTGG